MRGPGQFVSLATVVAGLVLGRVGWAQDTGAKEIPRPSSLEQLNAEHASKLDELEREHLKALLDLAGRLKGARAADAYEQAFLHAIAHDLYREAEPAAQCFLGEAPPSPEGRLRALASLVNLVAEADRGAFEEAQASMEAIVRRGIEQSPTRALDPTTALALGEGYIQRLVAGQRYDIARRACELISRRALDPGVKEHFGNRLRQFELVGEVAPPLEGTDLDGRPISLADLEGKLVLVDFWATWCPPCGPIMERYAALYRQHGGEGFEILGVNLDATAREGDTGADVRRFLVAHNVGWPNLVAPAGGGGPAESYRVTEIPASFLIGRDGRVSHVDLTPERLGSILAELAVPDRP